MLTWFGSRARGALTQCAAFFVLALLLVGQSFAGSVSLAWDAATDPAIIGYKVHRGPAAGNYTSAVDVGKVTSYTVPNLTDGSTYHFAITAYDAAGNQSPFSNDVVATVGYAKPVADFTASATSGVAPLAMNFSSNSTGTITTHAWTFGDGTTSSAQNPAKVYNSAGVYTVSLTVTGPGGSSTKTRANYITVTGTSDTSPPTTPASLSATASGSGTVNLSWSASTDNVGVTGYRIERCQGASCTNYAQIATATGTTYSNTGLSAATTYRYRVRAHDAAGNLSGYSPVGQVTTPATADTTPPTTPSSLAVTVSGTGSLILTWQASTDNIGVTGYRVERCQGNSCTNFVQIATSTGTRFVNSGLTAKTTYRYRVRANDAAGNVSGYSSISTGTTAATTGPDKSPPTAPASLTATAVASTAINLAWSPSTDNVGVYAYKVERCQGATCTNFVQIATPTSTTYTVNYLSAGTTYRYRVRATDVAGNKSDYSPVAAATTGGGADASPPTAPSGLTATASGTGSVTLAWSASTDNVGVTGYRIERCQGATCTSYAQIATSTSTSFSNTGLAAGTTYRYRVRANDAAGNVSGYSSVASATTASADALMAGLAFNEGNGTTATDEAGSGHSGTLVNGPTWLTGRFGNALSFDGVNDWVTVANPGTLNLAADFTIAAWVKRNALGGSGQRHILAKCGSSWASGCKELYFAGDTLRFGSYGTGDANSITIADTNWHHVAVTFTRTTNTIRIYVDGILRTTAVRNLEADGSSHGVTIGNMHGSNPFSGMIDEVRIYGQALDAGDISAAMNTPL